MNGFNVKIRSLGNVFKATPNRRLEETLQSAKSASVIDGDTVKLTTSTAEINLRILGINTPEKAEEGYSAAKKGLSNLLNDRGIFFRIVKEKTDRYGRTIGQIFVKDEEDLLDVGAEMIKRGLAHVFMVSPGELASDSVKEYLKLQTQAKKEKKGIWALPRYQGPLHITSFHPSPDRQSLRIASITDSKINLADFKLRRWDGEENFSDFNLPDFELPIGWSISVHAGVGRNKLNPSNGTLDFYIGEKKGIWDSDGALAVIWDSRNSKAVDWRRSKKGMEVPEQYQPLNFNELSTGISREVSHLWDPDIK